jgi:hypothetical protein
MSGTFLGALSTKSCKNAPNKCCHVCPPMCYISRTAEHIFITFYID